MTPKRKDHQITLPPLTHLQFAVLDALGTSETSGRELRARLKENGIKKSGPAFYQLMYRLEEARFVEGSYTEEIIDGQRIKERRYRMLGDGVRAFNDTLKFYESRDRQRARGTPAIA